MATPPSSSVSSLENLLTFEEVQKQLVRQSLFFAEATPHDPHDDVGFTHPFFAECTVSWPTQHPNALCEIRNEEDVNPDALCEIWNQEDVNSGWALSSAEHISAAHYLNEDDRSYKLYAAQDMVDALHLVYPRADRNYDTCCYSATPQETYRYLKEYGIGPETENGYVGCVKKAVKSRRTEGERVFIDGISPYPINRLNPRVIEPEVQELLECQPLWGSVWIFPSFASYDPSKYAEGIYVPKQEELDDMKSNRRGVRRHGVLIVGCGESNMVPKRAFFLIKNSWGPEWGKEGYSRVSADLVDALLYINGTFTKSNTTKEKEN